MMSLKKITHKINEGGNHIWKGGLVVVAVLIKDEHTYSFEIWISYGCLAKVDIVGL